MVQAVLAECDFDPVDTQHTYFNDLWNFMMGKNFSFFGLYDVMHYENGKGIGFCNALFVDPYLLLKNKRFAFCILLYFRSRSDASFIKVTLPGLCAMVEKANCKTKVIVDASDRTESWEGPWNKSKLTEVLKILEK